MHSSLIGQVKIQFSLFPEVVTAAHCLSGHTVKDFVFVIGKVDLRQPEPTDFLTIAKGLFIHPSYDQARFINDAAVVKLKDPVCFNKNIQPLPLPAAATPIPSSIATTLPLFHGHGFDTFFPFQERSELVDGAIH